MHSYASCMIEGLRSGWVSVDCCEIVGCSGVVTCVVEWFGGVEADYWTGGTACGGQLVHKVLLGRVVLRHFVAELALILAFLLVQKF